MSALIDHLRSFNRKERFILLSEALGRDHLGEGFRRRLGQAIGVMVPADAFVAMDYHLDWLQMALYLADEPEPPPRIPKEDVLAEGQDDYNTNQMDVDLLVAFDQGTTTHLALIEAKVDTGWTNRQMRRKAKRLHYIFGDSPDTEFIHPHFALLSPSRPQKLDMSRWPSWMKRDGTPVWMKLERPRGLRKVTRCDKDGHPSASGSHLKLVP